MQPSIVHVLLERAERQPSRIALRQKVDGRWVETTWREYAGLTRRVARGLIALGVEPGAAACIVGWNSSEWLVADLAVMAVGAVAAPLYTNCTVSQAEYIARHCGATVLFADSAEQIAKLRGLHDLRLATFIQWGGRPAEGVLSWSELLERGDAVEDSVLDDRLARLEPGGLATLIYTSGTTGPPKGAMLTHRNLVFTAEVAVETIGFGEQDSGLSYLPLSHVAEQIVSLYAPVTAGSCTSFAESMEQLGDNLREVRPTFFLGVPRVWEKIQARMIAAAQDNPPLKRRVAAWARGVGLRAMQRHERGRAAPWSYGLADRLVFSTVRERLGLDRARLCVSSTAPIARGTLDFFFSLGIPIYEVYGMTECTGPATISTPGAFRVGAAGRSMHQTELRIAEDGEILLRGGHVFAGYFKDEAQTQEALDAEGWLHTGDIGDVDRDGYLRVTDRKKDIIITAGGKNVAPQNIEALLKGIPGISQACVVGDRRKFLTALLTVDRENAALAARACGAATEQPEALAGDPAFRRHVEREIERINGELIRFETIKRFTILPNELTIEAGELTPTLKLRRRIVVERYAAQIEAMYASETVLGGAA